MHQNGVEVRPFLVKIQDDGIGTLASLNQSWPIHSDASIPNGNGMRNHNKPLKEQARATEPSMTRANISADLQNLTRIDDIRIGDAIDLGELLIGRSVSGCDSG